MVRKEFGRQPEAVRVIAELHKDDHRYLPFRAEAVGMLA